MRLDAAGALSPAALKEWFDGIDTFLLDCDGVIWRASDAVPGAAESIEYLRSKGKHVRFVSNNSTKTRGDYVAKLKEMLGIDTAEEEVVSSGYTAAQYCVRHGITKKVYCMGMPGLVKELTAAGLEVLGPGDHTKAFSFGKMAPGDLDPEVQAVVAGFDGHASFYKIAMAASYLRYGKGVKFVATNRDATFPDTHMLVPGGGVVVGAIETGSGRAPDAVVGKPSQDMLEILASAGGLVRDRTCMVGDRLDTDIVFGARGGLQSRLLVLTGINSEADALKYPAGDPHRPTHVIASFGDLKRVLEPVLG